MCKPMLTGKVNHWRDWLKVEYQTLNFGPTYELGRGALLTARDIVQGQFLLPDGTTNKSMLADWAIVADKSESNQLPYLEFKTGAKLLGRSYSEMGVAFKMKALAYISGDECADIHDLWTFTNNTLLPRLVSLDGTMDLVGTPQPDGNDYVRMIEMAEDDMKRKDYMTNGMFYTQRGSMYENEYLPRKAIEDIERIADPIMRRQIIEGEFVETGEKWFGYERVNNAVDTTIQLLEVGDPSRRYITSVDFAGGESEWADFTCMMVIDYTEEPYKVVYFNRFKGGDISIPMQYKMVEDVKTRFPGHLIIDTSALGGKNALAFLFHLNPISFDTLPKTKTDMLGTMKIVFDGGQSEKFRRTRVLDENQNWVDQNPTWGLIKFPHIPALVSELQNYRLDDKKLRTDSVMTLGMALHWIELRRPRSMKRSVIDFDLLSLS